MKIIRIIWNDYKEEEPFSGRPLDYALENWADLYNIGLVYVAKLEIPAKTLEDNFDEFARSLEAEDEDEKSVERSSDH